jgi:hypothetical protein
MVLLDLNFSPPVDEQDEVILDEEMVVEVDATGIVLSLLVKFSQC